jgi:uncharacterized damage-inducible protein DinB
LRRTETQRKEQDLSWTAPEVTRADPPLVGDERATLEGFLDYQRQTLMWKCSGLTAEQLRMRLVEPSTMSLLGLVRHMTEVERSWFRRRVAGEDIDLLYCSEADWDADFNGVDDADAEADLAAYAAELEAVRDVVKGRSLDDTFVHPRFNEEQSVRWVYVHMIEEYARHNGHADLLRERIDGATGE